MLVSVVAPCMNEEDGLGEFYQRVQGAIQEAKIFHYEIILVDDGSKDKTWDVITALHQADKNVKGVRLSRNFGQQSALTAGLAEAQGEYIFIIDSDLQDPPELLKDMLEVAQTGFDVVYGQRRTREGETFLKLVTAHAFYRFLSMMADINIPKDAGDFRLISRRVLKAYLELNETLRYSRGLIAWLGFKQTAILYDRHARYAGDTKYSLKKMISYSVDAITSFSLRPLRLIIHLGIMTALLALLTLGYTIYAWLINDTVVGWTSIMTVILLLGCVQLICIGVVGEYVGRTFTETKRRPIFLVQEKTESVEIGPLLGIEVKLAEKVQ